MGMIFELDMADGSAVSSFAPPDSWIMGIEYDGEHLWGVSQQTGRAFVMDLPSGNPVATYDWQVPYSLGMTIVDGCMWCASGKAPRGRAASTRLTSVKPRWPNCRAPGPSVG